MSYNKLLKNIFNGSNYTQQELANKCNVSRSYIGAILNDKNKIPDEKISREIAKACNVDERLLVIEGYLDKAPKEIKDAFLSIKNSAMLYSINMFENHVDKETINEIEKKFEEEPLADFIIDLIENGNNIINMKEHGFSLESKDNKIVCNLTNPISFKVEDNSMYPLIKENDDITLEIRDRYINGDIIVASVKGEKGVLIRSAVFLGRNVELIPLNREYKSKTYTEEEITILGKVKKIITEI